MWVSEGAREGAVAEPTEHAHMLPRHLVNLCFLFQVQLASNPVLDAWYGARDWALDHLEDNGAWVTSTSRSTVPPTSMSPSACLSRLPVPQMPRHLAEALGVVEMALVSRPSAGASKGIAMSAT
jgi:hypothetical protein